MHTNPPVVGLYLDAARAVFELCNEQTSFVDMWRNFDGERDEDGTFAGAVASMEAACAKARTALETAAAADPLYGPMNALTARALAFIGAGQLRILWALLREIASELNTAAAPTSVEH